MKISCVSSSITSISAELVASTQETVYPIVDGDGRGLAPIGHKPKIVSVTEIPINLILDLEYLDGYDFTSVSAGITSNITTFLRNLAATWKDDDEQNSHPCLVVRIANLISQISAVEGVQDINGITINQEKENTNLTLGTDDIPIMGTITEAVN